MYLRVLSRKTFPSTDTYIITVYPYQRVSQFLWCALLKPEPEHNVGRFARKLDDIFPKKTRNPDTRRFSSCCTNFIHYWRIFGVRNSETQFHALPTINNNRMQLIKKIVFVRCFIIFITKTLNDSSWFTIDRVRRVRCSDRIIPVLRWTTDSI